MSQAPLPKLPQIRQRDPRPRRARRAGWLLTVLGLLLTLPAAVLLAVVLNLLPLQMLLPATVRVTGPVTADMRAKLSLAVVAVLGAVALAQGVHQLVRGERSWKLLGTTLLLGALFVAALVLSGPSG